MTVPLRPRPPTQRGTVGRAVSRTAASVSTAQAVPLSGPTPSAWCSPQRRHPPYGPPSGPLSHLGESAPGCVTCDSQTKRAYPLRRSGPCFATSCNRHPILCSVSGQGAAGPLTTEARDIHRLFPAYPRAPGRYAQDIQRISTTSSSKTGCSVERIRIRWRHSRGAYSGGTSEGARDGIPREACLALRIERRERDR